MNKEYTSRLWIDTVYRQALFVVVGCRSGSWFMLLRGFGSRFKLIDIVTHNGLNCAIYMRDTHKSQNKKTAGTPPRNVLYVKRGS